VVYVNRRKQPSGRVCILCGKGVRHDKKIAIGYELPKERWICATKNLKQVAPAIANFLLRMNGDGMGQEDADDFTNDIMLACTALSYVAEFAADKCRMVPVPEGFLKRGKSNG
jgi:hypothetical protein